MHHIRVHMRRYRCQLFIVRGCIACVWVLKALTTASATWAGNNVCWALFDVLEKTAVRNSSRYQKDDDRCSMCIALIPRSPFKTRCVCGSHKSHLPSVNLVTCRSSSGLTFDVDGIGTDVSFASPLKSLVVTSGTESL